MSRGDTFNALDTTGTAVLRIVESRDCMKKATATSQGRKTLLTTADFAEAADTMRSSSNSRACYHVLLKSLDREREFMNVTRSQALAGAAFVAASGNTALAQAAPTSIRVASSPVGDVIPLLYAQNSGLFRNAGLDIALQKSNSGSAVAAALVGGEIEIGGERSLSQARRASR
jgi:hypothetical protein